MSDTGADPFQPISLAIQPYVTALYRASLGYRPLPSAPANSAGYLALMKADPSLATKMQAAIDWVKASQLDQRDYDRKVQVQMLTKMLQTFQEQTNG